MRPLDSAAVGALRTILDGQPMSDAKLLFAWRIAAGPALSRAATPVLLPNGTLLVRARSEAWRKEIARARPLIEARITEMLGTGVVRRVTVQSDPDEPSPRSGRGKR